MKATLSIVSVLALTMVASRAESQTGSRIKLGAAFGPGWELNGEGRPSGAHFGLSGTLVRAKSLTSYRLETMLDATEQVHQTDALQSEVRRHATFALTLSAVRSFSKKHTGPYLIGGIGLYHQWNEVIQSDQALGESAIRGLWSNANVGFNVGAGLTFHMLHQELFIEGRYHTTGFESRIPVSIGIRI